MSLPRRLSATPPGNTARLRHLDSGVIAVGRAADLVFLDKAQHSAGRDLLDSVRLGEYSGRWDGSRRWSHSMSKKPQYPTRDTSARGRFMRAAQ